MAKPSAPHLGPESLMGGVLTPIRLRARERLGVSRRGQLGCPPSGGLGKGLECGRASGVAAPNGCTQSGIGFLFRRSVFPNTRVPNWAHWPSSHALLRWIGANSALLFRVWRCVPSRWCIPVAAVCAELPWVGTVPVPSSLVRDRHLFSGCA